MSADPWLYWYWGKEGKVEHEIPGLEPFFRRNNVSKILDLGCGTGRHSLFFAKRGFQVWGFDRSKAAVKRAAELFKRENLFANLKCWDMTNIPFPYGNTFFDAVLAVKVIHHASLANIRRIVIEIKRITKNSGYLFLNSPTYGKALRLSREGVKSEEVEPGTFLPLEGEEKGVLHHHFTKEELLELLHGYEISDIHERDEHYCVLGRKKE